MNRGLVMNHGLMTIGELSRRSGTANWPPSISVPSGMLAGLPW